jgi:hypothetical protein
VNNTCGHATLPLAIEPGEQRRHYEEMRPFAGTNSGLTQQQDCNNHFLIPGNQKAQTGTGINGKACIFNAATP